MKLNQKIINVETKLNILIFVLFGLFVIVFYQIGELQPKKEIIKDSIIIKVTDILNYPNDYKITCEPGVSHIKYHDYQVIYGCLKIVDNKCNGEGKVCILEYEK